MNLFTSNRLDQLVDRLADNAASAGTDPLEESVIVVQSPGMERWLAMQLADRLGVWANCRYPFPNALVAGLLDSVLHHQYGERASVFDRAVLKWRVYDILRTHAGEPVFAELAGYMGASPSTLRTYQLAEQVADVFDQYMVYRPQMLLDWEDDAGPPMSENQWQPAMWRLLSSTESGLHRARMKLRFHEKLSGMKKKEFQQQYGNMLPGALHLFGVTSLPPFHIEVLAEISRFIPVHVYQLNPCKEFWYDIEKEAKISRVEKQYNLRYGKVPRHHMEVGNSLLASLGLVGKQFIPMVWEYARNEPFDDAAYRKNPGDSVLTMVQNDILDLVDRGAPSGKDDPDYQQMRISPLDRSIQVHSCHGPMREAEVLRDVLLDQFNTTPGLEPQNVLVMIPDIDTYAPYIDAVFGNPGSGEQYIPYSIADQNLRSVSTTIDTFFAVLDCMDSRFEAGRVFEILQCDDVARKFNLSPADLDLVQSWIRETGIHWGIDDTHRARLDQPPTVIHSWRYGLDRMILGFAMPGDDTFIYNDILPYDHIEGDNAAVLGNLADFCHLLFSLVETFSGSAGIQDWHSRINLLLDELFEPSDDTQRYVQMIRDRMLQLADDVTGDIFDGTIDLPVLRSWLQNEISEERVSTSFMTGGITFCATLPMRSIPFEIICMMGMNDDTFPRKDRVRGFDLMYQEGGPRPGDRSTRNDDRYLFLETIVSAKSLLCITFTGQSARDNSSIPPSVVVSELLDYLEQGYTVESADGEDILSHVVTTHHLQSFSPAYFTGNQRLFSYSATRLEACKSLVDDRKDMPSFAGNPLPSLSSDEGAIITLDELVKFFDNPAAFYCTRRLGIQPEIRFDEMDDREPFNLGSLETFSITSELCEMYLDHEDIQNMRAVINARGMLPQGTWGGVIYTHAEKRALRFAHKVAEVTGDVPPSEMTVDIQFHTSRVRGVISGIRGDRLVRFSPVKIKGRDILRGWIYHCAVNGVDEVSGCSTVCVFKDAVAAFEPVTRSQARQVLGELVELFHRGNEKPLLFFPGTSWEYASAILTGKDEKKAYGSAKRQWEGSDFNGGYGGDMNDASVSLCFDEKAISSKEFRNHAMNIYTPVFEHLSVDTDGI